MTREHARVHEDEATEKRSEAEFIEAGEYFTAAAYERLGTQPPDRFGQLISHGTQNLLHAGLCYRLGDRQDRCENRCRQGILVAQDMKERVMAMQTPANSYDQARRGAWIEFIGDFRLIGKLEGVEEAYANAVDVYSEAGDPQVGLNEQEHLNLIEFFEEIALAVGEDLDSWYEAKCSISLTDWVERKQSRLPIYLDELVEHSEWSI